MGYFSKDPRLQDRGPSITLRCCLRWTILDPYDKIAKVSYNVAFYDCTMTHVPSFTSNDKVSYELMVRQHYLKEEEKNKDFLSR